MLEPIPFAGMMEIDAMNANELADELDFIASDYDSSTVKFHKEIATMLRQQQNLLDEYHKQSLNDSRAISKLVGEMAEKETEIEALKAEIVSIEKNTDYWADKANWIKNNEPVAWMRKSDKAVCSNEEKLWFIEEEGSNWNYVIPLYTHPVKELTEEKSYEVVFDGEKYTTKLVEPKVKELTDEEIDELANKYLYVLNDVHYANDIKDFARAILRKAQEK